MKNFSLRNRLIFAVVVSQVLLAMGLVIIGTSFSYHYIRRAFDVYVDGRAQSVAALVYYPDDGSPGLLFNETKIPLSSHSKHKDIFVVSSDHGDFERHTAGYDPHIFDQIPPDEQFWNFRLDGTPYRAIILRDVAILDTEEGIPEPLPKLTVIYAAPSFDIEQQIARLGLTIAALSLLIFIPIMLLALRSIRKALAPLNDLAMTAGSISVDSWRFEPSEAAKSTQELRPLIGAVTTVLVGLESAFTLQREFLGNAAHELKTSLAILKSTLQTLLNKPRQSNEYESGLNTMNRDCERLERLLNRMLQTARAEQRLASGRESQPGPVDLIASCEAAIVQLARFAAEREIRIDFSATGEAMICAESADLELIWLNLLENAIQYSPSESIIEVTGVVHPRTVTVTVSDHGCGIEAAHLPHVFERFYRADYSRARATGGFGLGLAISKSLVTLYGGHIRAESTPKNGSRFTVDFPLNEDLVGRRPGSDSTAPAAPSQTASAKALP
ncbi:MAG TPA: HAMP domain-containing sensor histidine kinase [Terracidiphilus sp.]|jgi:signal transduction histidine kinase|nr:HAMP domain-containing sensor histidine kinase [Terracidiphilus sp.]